MTEEERKELESLLMELTEGELSSEQSHRLAEVIRQHEGEPLGLSSRRRVEGLEDDGAAAISRRSCEFPVRWNHRKYIPGRGHIRSSRPRLEMVHHYSP